MAIHAVYRVQSLEGCRQLLRSGGGGGGLASRIEFVARNESRIHIFGHF